MNFGGSLGSFGGSSAGAAYVRLVLESGQYQSQLKSAGAQTTASVSKMGSEFRRLGGYMRQALGTIGIIQLVRQSIAAYDEQTKAVARLNIAFSNSPALIGASTRAFTEQASALAKLTGVADEQIIGAQAALAVFGLTEDQLRRLTPLVLDFAAFTGQDATAAATALGRAALGNARALKSVGIEFERTGNRAEDFEIIMSSLSAKVGGTAEAVATPMDKLRVAADEVFEVIGQALAPTLEGLSKLLGALPPVLAAAAVGFVALKVAGAGAMGAFLRWAPWVLGVTQGLALLNDTLDESQTFIDAVANRVEYFMGLVGAEAARDSWLTQGLAQLPGFKAAIEDAALAMQGFETATQAATDANLELLAAQYQLAGGMLGLVSSANSASDAENKLAEARAEVNRLANAGQQGTAAYAAAQRELADAALSSTSAQLGLENAVVGVMESINNGETTRAQAITDLRAMGARAGLTAGEISTLIARILAIPDNSYTNIQINNAEALAKIASTINALAEIPAYKTVSISVVTSGAAQYGGQLAIGGGGIVRGASGFITRGPTFMAPNKLVGEAGYSTPFGRGAEAVIPLTDATLDRLADAMDRRRGGSATVNVNGYAGDPERLAAYIVRYMARAS